MSAGIRLLRTIFVGVLGAIFGAFFGAGLGAWLAPGNPVVWAASGVVGCAAGCLISAGGFLWATSEARWEGESEAASPLVVARPAAAAFVRGHGATVFVWVDRAGLKRVTMGPPEQAVAFSPLEGDGFTLYVDSAIKAPLRWTIRLRHFPRRHIDVLWGDRQPEQWASLPP